MSTDNVVIDVCPECKEVRCRELFGDVWFKSPGMNPGVQHWPKLCPHCDSLMPLVKRLEFFREHSSKQLELF